MKLLAEIEIANENVGALHHPTASALSIQTGTQINKT
jgi:hypothetical protein